MRGVAKRQSRERTARRGKPEGPCSQRQDRPVQIGDRVIEHDEGIVASVVPTITPTSLPDGHTVRLSRPHEPPFMSSVDESRHSLISRDNRAHT